MPRAAGAAVVVTVLALATAGCGNEKHDFRVEKLQPLVQRVNEQRSQLGSALRLARPRRAEDATVLRAQIARLRDAMSRLAALTPPAGTEAKFRRYTRANTALLTSLSRFVEAFATGNPDDQRRAAQDSQAALAVVSRTETALEHALG
jgi:cytochrome c556